MKGSDERGLAIRMASDVSNCLKEIVMLRRCTLLLTLILKYGQQVELRIVINHFTPYS